MTHLAFYTYKIIQEVIQSQTVMRSLLVLQHILTCHQKADVRLLAAPVYQCLLADADSS